MITFFIGLTFGLVAGYGICAYMDLIARQNTIMDSQPQPVPVEILEVWAAVDMRQHCHPRHYEIISSVDKLGLRTADKPPEISGWKLVKLKGVIE